MVIFSPALRLRRARVRLHCERETAHAGVSHSAITPGTQSKRATRVGARCVAQFMRVSRQQSANESLVIHFLGQRCTIYLAAYALITLQRKLLSINGHMDVVGVPRMWLFAEETVSPRVDKRANSTKPGV